MINELIIHLGDTKTGSTSIQKALVGNICATPGKTILYPTGNQHRNLAKTLSTQRLFGAREAQFNRVYSAFQDSDADYGIVSAEHFQFVEPQALRDAIGTYWPELLGQVRLLAYVRPHAEKMLSAFSERVKLGADLRSLESFFDILSAGAALDYAPRFEKWRDTFGARFELRPFVRERLYQGDVVADFFRFVLGGENFEIKTPIEANSSLTVSQLSLLREVHKRLNATLGPARGPRRKEVLGSLGRLITDHIQSQGLGRDSERLRLPAALVERFTARYAADAEALDTGFFDGFPMSEALENIHLKTTETAQSLEAADHFAPDVIGSVQSFAQVLADMMARNPKKFRKMVAGVRAGAETGA